MVSLIFMTAEMFGLLCYLGMDVYMTAEHLNEYMNFRLHGQIFLFSYYLSFYGKNIQNVIDAFSMLGSMCQILVSFDIRFFITYATMVGIIVNGVFFLNFVVLQNLSSKPVIFLCVHWLVQFFVWIGFICFTKCWYDKMQAFMSAHIVTRGEYEHILQQLESMNTSLLAALKPGTNERKPLNFDVQHTECIICHEQTVDGAAVDLPCAHHYCSNCILRWFWTKKAFQCPYCRQ